MEFSTILMWLFIIATITGFGSLIFAMVDDAINGQERVENECKQDCEELELDYFKAKRGAWNQNSCICVNGDNQPITLW